jgi:hypothetical protein
MLSNVKIRLYDTEINNSTTGMDAYHGISCFTARYKIEMKIGA